jgi:hypothetical protein
MEASEMTDTILLNDSAPEGGRKGNKDGKFDHKRREAPRSLAETYDMKKKKPQGGAKAPPQLHFPELKQKVSKTSRDC